jgi:hypothetical protein
MLCHIAWFEGAALPGVAAATKPKITAKEPAILAGDNKVENILVWRPFVSLMKTGRHGSS